MNCTSCKNGALVPSFIDGLFRAHTCDYCGGNWLLIEDYVAWKERNPQYQFKCDVSFEESEVTDTRVALLCPASGTFMRKFKITAEHVHKLDYSSATGGLWLDKGEWELLKQEGIAGCLNAVITPNWQRWIRQDNTKQSLSDNYRAKFGDEVYDKVQEIRTWLLSQEQKADLRAYLLAEDPYSAQK
ncbi:zf-TFIIB domain-containing protein [Pseudoalteromonas sp. JBTF-M23]|uniref:Zf-TFIIB domain-containing protein n=1 Tax=Pseudoalteromonas caenipelagi TaxID=2726988 RepID=A0A849V9M8_9GAMM|nr:zf-TFIIB domain-containing protein [Pseudoalteromonas caenipelagi]NOU50062.1 zf-TFIIB domain-containing protein [Pseudoalteromonas caenipelagi]